MQQGTGLVSWEIIYAKQALKDAKKLATAGLKDKALLLLEILKIDPYQNPPPYEKLVGVLLRINSRNEIFFYISPPKASVFFQAKLHKETVLP